MKSIKPPKRPNNAVDHLSPREWHRKDVAPGLTGALRRTGPRSWEIEKRRRQEWKAKH